MDWQLVGLTLLFATPGLLGGLVGLLGFTRTEKVLAAAYFVGFATMFVVHNIFFSADVPDLRTKADVDAWVARMHSAHTIASGVGWFCVLVATTFCVVALVHIWRERSLLWKTLGVKT